MKALPSLFTMAAAAALLTLSTAQSQAQERGRFDPEEMRARMMERTREQLKVNSDDEWKVMEPRIQAVNDARRELFSLTPRGRGFGGPGGPGGRGGRGGAGGDANREGRGGEGGRGEGRRGGPGGFGEPSPQVQALEKAIESDASADEVKSKLAALRTARKEQQAKLAKAQENLRQVLSVKQEAGAVLMGLLE